MSHSSAVDEDRHEESNGTDRSDLTDACHWPGPLSVSHMQCRAGVALEEDNQEGHFEAIMHAGQSMDPVCRQKQTNLTPHTNINASHEGFLHTEDSSHKHAPQLQPVTKDSFYMDITNPAHTNPNDDRNGTEMVKDGEKETVGPDDDDDDDDDDNDDKVKVNKIKDKQHTADDSVQPTQESPEDSKSSQTPPPDQPDSISASFFGSRSSSSSTPPDQAPPLVPAPMLNSAPSSVLPEPDKWPPPVHVMAEVRVRSAPGRERVVRGMQDSKSLDGISEACGGGTRAAVGKGGQAEGRRATISSALELDGTVSYEGDLTNFITKNLEQKIKMSSRPSLDTDSDCSGPVVRGRGSLRRPADIPPIDPSVLVDLHKHTQTVANSVEIMLRSLNGTIQNMTALSVGYIQTYRDSVDSLGESVDMSIKGMYTLMARCEELDRSMAPIQTLAAQIRDIKRTLDALEAICK